MEQQGGLGHSMQIATDSSPINSMQIAVKTEYLTVCPV
jgi:hypothetical protein